MTKKQKVLLTPLFLTKEKIAKIKAEIEQIEKELMPSIRFRLARALEDGDIPENNPFIMAHEDLQLAMKRRSELRELLFRAKLYTTRPRADTIHLGSIVTIRTNKTPHIVISIVSSEEANPIEHKISEESPLGRALMHKKAGDNSTFETPNGTQEVTIVNIE